MRLAQIDNYKIINIIDCETLLDGWTTVPDTANIGYVLVDGVWVPDAASIPVQTLDEYKKEAKDRLSVITSRKLRKVIGEDSHEEAISVLIAWMAAEAIAATTATAAQIAMLTNEATRRGKTLNNIATNLAADYATAQDKIGHIRGISRNAKSLINDALTEVDVDTALQSAKTEMNLVINGS